MMFTDGGSGDVDYTTPAAVVGCQDLNGRWTSKQTTERMDLNHNEDDSLEGLYNACANCGWLGVQGRKATAQFTLGLTMVGQGGDLVTSWAGEDNTIYYTTKVPIVYCVWRRHYIVEE